MSFTEEQIKSCPSMKGKFANKDVRLTEYEIAVARYQGLIGPDGKLTDEAVEKITPDKVTNIIPIDELVDDPDGIASKLEAVKQEVHGSETNVDPSLQIGKPLDPPNTVSGTDLTNLNPSQVTTVIKSCSFPVVCDHCKYDIRNQFKEPPYTEDDKLAFVRHVFAPGSRFYKTYEMFNGSVKVTLRSRTIDETTKIIEHIRELLVAGKDKLGAADATALAQKYMCANAIDSIETNNTTTKYIAVADSSPDAVHAAVFGNGTASAMYSIVFSAFLEFDRLYDWFTSMAHDANFWAAAAGHTS